MRTTVHAACGLHHHRCHLDILSNQPGRNAFSLGCAYEAEKEAVRGCLAEVGFSAVPGEQGQEAGQGVGGSRVEVFWLYFFSWRGEDRQWHFACVPFCLLKLCRPVAYVFVVNCRNELRWPYTCPCGLFVSDCIALVHLLEIVLISVTNWSQSLDDLSQWSLFSKFC